jgi:hypothetical protein
MQMINEMGAQQIKAMQIQACQQKEALDAQEIMFKKQKEHFEDQIIKQQTIIESLTTQVCQLVHAFNARETEHTRPKAKVELRSERAASPSPKRKVTKLRPVPVDTSDNKDGEEDIFVQLSNALAKKDLSLFSASIPCADSQE